MNEDAIFNPATYFGGEALHVHGDPISWLRGRREGIVILRMDLAYWYLRRVPRISVSDAAFGRTLREALRPPAPRCEILLRVEELAA